VKCQVPGEDIAQFDSSQVFHRRTVAHRSDMKRSDMKRSDMKRSDMKPKFAQRRAIRHMVSLSDSPDG
jgi:hypothetical protein